MLGAGKPVRVASGSSSGALRSRPSISCTCGPTCIGRTCAVASRCATLDRSPTNHPEGPIRAGTERPDSSANAFCLGCHHATGQGGLSIAALEPVEGLLAEHDPRRQPMQAVRRVLGNIPGGRSSDNREHWPKTGARR